MNAEPNAPRTHAFTPRLAGLFYLVVAVTGFFSFYVSQSVLVPGDSAATATAILASRNLYLLGAMSEVVMMIFWLLTAFALHTLFVQANRNLALLMLAFVVSGSAVTTVISFLRLETLLLLTGTHVPQLSATQPDELAMFFLELAHNGVYMAYVFYGLWLFPLGYLVYSSGLFPRVLGLLLLMAALGYLVDFGLFFTGQDMEITMFTFWGELFLLLWLLIRGARILRPQK